MHMLYPTASCTSAHGPDALVLCVLVRSRTRSRTVLLSREEAVVGRGSLRVGMQRQYAVCCTMSDDRVSYSLPTAQACCSRLDVRTGDGAADPW